MLELGVEEELELGVEEELELGVEELESPEQLTTMYSTLAL